MLTFVGIQDEYIETVNAGFARWSHRKDGGHSSRIMRGARRKAEKQLCSLGFTEEQARVAVDDAHDMAKIQRVSSYE